MQKMRQVFTAGPLQGGRQQLREDVRRVLPSANVRQTMETVFVPASPILDYISMSDLVKEKQSV